MNSEALISVDGVVEPLVELKLVPHPDQRRSEITLLDYGMPEVLSR